MGEKDNKYQTVCVNINGERKPLEVVELDELTPDITEDNCEEMAAELFSDCTIELSLSSVPRRLRMRIYLQYIKAGLRGMWRALIGK